MENQQPTNCLAAESGPPNSPLERSDGFGRKAASLLRGKVKVKKLSQTKISGDGR